MLHRLFKRRTRRHFAQLDAQGRCKSLWTLSQAPEHGNWVEVNASNPLWIGHALPGTALATPARPVSCQNLRSLPA